MKRPDKISIILAALALGAGHLPSAEVLYNGIRLPDEWPPRGLDPKSDAPMDVPYLKNPPAVIPIGIGRQLFVDDFLIEKTDLRRTFHKPKDHPGNPVLVPATAAELARTKGSEGEQEAVCYLGAGGVFYDPADALFKMWYTAGWRGGIAMATSRDGFAWERPELGLAGGNVVLAPGMNEPKAGWDNGVYLDLATRNPSERFKFLAQRPKKGHTLHTSTDGRAWSRGVTAGPAADYCSFFYNPFRDVWVHSIKRNGPRGRARDYAESREFMRPGIYRHSVYWTNADRLDHPDPAVGDAAQLYILHGMAYESILLGMFSIHLGPHNTLCDEGRFPKITELKLGFSRDGFHWDRPQREPFIQATRKEGDWNRGYLHGATGVCLVAGDWLYFSYTGYSGISPTGWRGLYTGASIGMAVLRRDGFASMDADGKDGTLTTRPVRFGGRHLFVNVDCPGGGLLAEVLDASGEVINGYAKSDCLPVRANKTLVAVGWKGGRDLAALGDTPVRFRFYLSNGKLYSFWVGKDESGASLGFVAAGGPGYDRIYDTKGLHAYEEARAVMPAAMSLE
ncbi:hypothetical protein OH491_14250 [Termitidicoccus mucosus]|uniref:Glycosyl hydrolase family 32 n=1 Tax=Termitidicoccus mucosus TaxID=1184151 RepID=A0A178II21_9BACT|nr:hypothetical protein AW736_13200 [Opitutaceae bacterium TSB47]